MHGSKAPRRRTLAGALRGYPRPRQQRDREIPRCAIPRSMARAAGPAAPRRSRAAGSAFHHPGVVAVRVRDAVRRTRRGREVRDRAASRGVHRGWCPVLGFEVSRRRVMYLSCEDRVGILRSRVCARVGFLGISLASLRGWLEVFDLVGQDSVLWERDPRTGHVIAGCLGCLSERISNTERKCFSSTASRTPSAATRTRRPRSSAM